MPRQMLDAQEIKPGQKGWTCIVQVIERHPVGYKTLTSYPFQKRYRHYLLTDMKGTKIKAVLFDNDIEFFERSLQPFRRYQISNAAVTLPQEKYQLEGYKYSWIVTAKIPVEPIADPKPYPLPCSFDVCKFADLHKFAETDANIAIKGLIVHQFPVIDISNTRSAKDYVLVNEEEIPLVIRFWKDLLAPYDPSVESFHKGPVTIIASNLHVKTFHGLSLATRESTYIIENPPLPESDTLNKWYDENKQKIPGWLKDKAYEDTRRFFVPPEPENVLPLTAAMASFDTVKTCWIKGRLRLSVTRSPLYYIVCGHCGIEVDAGLDWDVTCSGCGVLSPMEIKIKLPVTLNDDNTNMRSTIRSPDAEKLVPFTPAEIMQKQEEGQSVVDDISIAMDNTEAVCFVKYYDKKMDSAVARRYVILKTYTLTELEEIGQDKALVTPETIRLDSQAHSALPSEATLVPPTSNKEASSQAEFFTPTTKKILEEVAQQGTQASTSSTASPAAKRSISFGTITAQDLQAAALEQPALQSPATAETPAKKNKGEKN